MVLKKIGAILEPRQTPPKRLFGTKGMSPPVNHSTELVATCGGTGADHVTDVGDQRLPWRPALRAA